MPVAEALEHLVGMQAQEPWDPYYALWSRLAGFDPNELGGMIERFEAVRMGVMRGTIHLMTARDALVLRGVMAPVMSGTYRSSMFSRQVEGVDLDELLAIAAELTAEKPHGRTDLSRRSLREMAGGGLRRARLHGDVSAAAGAGSSARGVGEDEGGEVAERGEGAWRRGRVGRGPGRGGAPLPAGVRAGGVEGRAGLVLSDRAAGGDRRAASPASGLSNGRGCRALRRRGRVASRIPRRRRRCGSCLSTTTRSSASPIAAGSCRPLRESART